MPHRFWNAGDDTLCFRAEVRPALRFESLIETMFGLAADGKTNGRGMPNPFRLAVIANHHFGVVRLPRIPHRMQKAGLVLGAPLAACSATSRRTRPPPASSHSRSRRAATQSRRRASPARRRPGPRNANHSYPLLAMA